MHAHQVNPKSRNYTFLNHKFTSYRKSFSMWKDCFSTGKSMTCVIILKNLFRNQEDSIMCSDPNRKTFTKNLSYSILYEELLDLWLDRRILIEDIFFIPKRAIKVSVLKADKSSNLHKHKNCNLIQKLSKPPTKLIPNTKNMTFWCVTKLVIRNCLKS